MNVQSIVQIDVTDLNDQQRRRLAHLIESAVQKVRAEQPAKPTGVQWGNPTVETALTRLTSEGFNAQAETIRQAARNGGTVSRAEVYRLSGYSEDRSLKGFTRPVNRICDQLRNAGVVPADAPNLLTTIYDDEASGYQRAGGFEIPPAVVSMIAG